MKYLLHVCLKHSSTGTRENACATSQKTPVARLRSYAATSSDVEFPNKRRNCLNMFLIKCLYLGDCLSCQICQIWEYCPIHFVKISFYTDLYKLWYSCPHYNRPFKQWLSWTILWRSHGTGESMQAVLGCQVCLCPNSQGGLCQNTQTSNLKRWIHGRKCISDTLLVCRLVSIENWNTWTLEWWNVCFHSGTMTLHSKKLKSIRLSEDELMILRCCAQTLTHTLHISW